MSTQPKDGREAFERAADKVYDGNAAEPLPERKGEFHSYSPAAEVIRQRGTELFAQTGMTTREQQQLEETFRGIQKTTGLPDGLVAKIADGYVNNRLAGARVSDDADRDDLELSQRIAAANTELRERFSRRCGAKDGEALLDRTQRFIRKHPTLAKMLQERGLGSDRDIVEGVAAHVWSIGWRG